MSKHTIDCYMHTICPNCGRSNPDMRWVHDWLEHGWCWCGTVYKLPPPVPHYADDPQWAWNEAANDYVLEAQ